MRPFAETGVQWERAWRRARFRGWSAGLPCGAQRGIGPVVGRGEAIPLGSEGEQDAHPRGPLVVVAASELGGSPARTRCDQLEALEALLVQVPDGLSPQRGRVAAPPIGLDLAPAWVLDGPAPLLLPRAARVLEVRPLRCARPAR